MTTDSTDTRAQRRKSPKKPENALVSADRAGAGLDRGFAGLAKAAGIFILIILAFVAIFLSWNSVGALYQEEEGLIIGRFLSYAWPFALGTVVVAILALIMGAPIAIAVALYISHYAPPKASKTIGYIIDLLAAIPSVVYGAWGMFVLAPAMVPLYHWLSQWLYTWPEENLGWGIPFFAGSPGLGQNIFTASVVLAVMILPIISSVCREIFIQTPKLHEEAALALGATRWEMIKMAVFPFARPGIISGVMLGLGRALGETMAVVMVVSGLGFQLSIISPGNSTIPREIALNFGETGHGTERWHQLVALGLVLFVITLAVNMVARWIVSRHKEFSGAN
ncbi:phosphate ABC transporter permease subunit PstC [Nesterenkonia alkaliphila]|uniref:phosphate ABC transporter permease subunit PstC n=1 Tax=Nesterenkonia alkaliphila TaxID=1463631 RepID=UPI0019CD5F88|nr:phosphate transport system permease protein [Nesterenkonia alkaliphila]